MVVATQQVQRKARWHVCSRCAWWRSAMVRWKKKKGRTGDAALCGTWLGAVDDDGTRFIVPLGILHLPFLAAKLAVYATSDWHSSASACTLLSIIPAFSFTRHYYRMIFLKIRSQLLLGMKFVRRICGDIRKKRVEDCDYRWFRILLSH